MRRMDFCGVIVAAGAGVRAGPGGAKQWRLLAGKPLCRWSLEAMLSAGAREVVVVIGPDDEATARTAFAGLEGWRLTFGGAARVDSTLAGLKALSSSAARRRSHSRRGTAVSDLRSYWQAPRRAGQVRGRHPRPSRRRYPQANWGDRRRAGHGRSRQGSWRAQTPQAFNFAPLLSAFAAWPADETPTDDAQIVERAGGTVALVDGDPMLMKLTYPEDFAMAERLAGGARVTRIGQGFDAHRFGPGDGVWLCGVKIAHDRALIGHSDADAGLHALTDALLGAIGEGDIGDHFPPSDPQWKGAASSAFLAHAMALVAARGGRVINVDVTLICERPKIKPHREAMRTRVAEILGLPLDRVSVKATTTEAMGFTGREEGLAAQAVAAVETPL